MTIYYLIYICIPVLYLVDEYFFKRKKAAFFLSGFLLFIISAFRNYTVGTDTVTYKMVFDSTSNLSYSFSQIKDTFNLESGYLILNRIIGYLHGDFRFFLVITSFITIFGYFYFIKKYSVNSFMSITLFVGLTYYFMSFNISRQFLATAICFLALCFIKDNKLMISIVLVLLATTIHMTSLTFLPLILLIRFGKSKRWLLAVLWISVFLMGVSPFIIKRMMITNRYSYYLSNSTDRSLFSIIFTFILFIMLFILIKEFNFSVATSLDYLMLYGMLFVCFFDLLVIFVPSISRLKYVFEPLIIVIIPYFLKKNKVEPFILFNLIFLILGIVIMSYLIPNNIFYGIDPYIFG